MASIRKSNDRGAGFIEYALLMAFIAAVVFVSIVAFSDNTQTLFATASSNVHAP